MKRRPTFPPPPLDFRFLDLLILVSVGLASVALVIPGRTTRLTIANTQLARALEDDVYEQPLIARGGNEPYVWSVKGLPAGVAANANGTLKGSPSVVGHFDVLAKVTSEDGQHAEARFGLDVLRLPGLQAPRIRTEQLPTARVGVDYYLALAAEGGALPYRWTASGLPEGISVRDGVLVGRPNREVVTTSHIAVFDSLDKKSERDITLRVLPNSQFEARYAGRLRITSVLPKAIARTPYSVQLAAAGGSPPYQWKLLSSSPQLSLSADGVLTTSETPLGLAGVDVRVYDDAGQHADAYLSLDVMRPTDTWMKVVSAFGATVAFVILLFVARAWIAQGPRLLRMRLTDGGMWLSVGFAMLAAAVCLNGPATTLLFVSFCSVLGVVALRAHD